MALQKLIAEVEELIEVRKAKGNWGHAGVPGQRGGSAPKGGGGVSSVKVDYKNVSDAFKNAGFTVKKVGSNAMKVGLNRKTNTLEVQTVLDEKFPGKEFTVKKADSNNALVAWDERTQ